jgi:hypothetical protein
MHIWYNATAHMVHTPTVFFEGHIMFTTPRAVVKLLPCDYEVMGSSPGNSLLQKCR